MLRSRWTVALVCSALFFVAGCLNDERPDPPPVAEIRIGADGGYLLDARPVTPERLDRELTRRAAEERNEKLGRTRLQVKVSFAPGTAYDRVQALVERCQGLGIVQVEVQR